MNDLNKDKDLEIMRKAHIVIKELYRRTNGSWSFPVVLCGDHSGLWTVKNFDNVSQKRQCKKCQHQLMKQETKKEYK